jgi:hypothetical protein
MGKRARRRGEAGEDLASSASAADAPEQEPSEDGAEPASAQKGGAPQGDIRLRQAMDYVEEADHLLALFRWTLLTGEMPRPEDWLPREDWPHPDQVGHVFGSWNRFIEYSGLRDAPPLLRKRAQDEREARLEGRGRQLEREEKRAADMRRQLDVARRKRDEAEALRDEQARQVTELERRVGAAERRAETAEQSLAERREAAERAVAETASDDGPGDDWLRAHEATLAELEQVRAHRDELLREKEALEAEAARQRQAIGELSAALGGGAGAADSEPEAAATEEPASVLEAVRTARETLPHLVFTESAEESAADSPFRRPQEILDTLRKLDRLGELYADPDGFGSSLLQAAQEQGLQWRTGVSELARNRWPNAYNVTYDGHTLDLGPHIAIGSGSGAGFVARIYLHVADGSGGVPRGLYIGHVGRHLPDTTT